MRRRSITLASNNNSKYIVALAVMILLFSGLCMSNPILVDGDLATTYYFDNGATFHNGTDIHMPEANVSIAYTHRTSGDHLSISCAFEIFTNTTQTTTLAFAHPITWGYYPINYNNSMDIFISRDTVPIDYTIYSWEQLGWNSTEYEELEYKSNWINESLYAVFNLELFGNTTERISVDVLFSDYPKTENFYIQYIVSSARTFESDTHQRIHAQINEEQSIYEMYFTPHDFLSVEEHEDTTNAYWDFYVSAFEYDYIEVRLYLTEHPPLPDPTTTNLVLDPLLVAQVGVVAVIILCPFLILLYYRRG